MFTKRHFAYTTALVVISLNTSACQTTPVGIEVRKVPVPTPVACVDRDQLPVEPERVLGKLTGNAVVDLSIVAASALELRRWGEEQAALLEGCSQ